MDKEKIKKALKIIQTICFFIVLIGLFLAFSWYGVIGYFIFVGIMATYILIKRRKQYILICKYGAKQLEKVLNNGKNKEND